MPADADSLPILFINVQRLLRTSIYKRVVGPHLDDNSDPIVNSYRVDRSFFERVTDVDAAFAKLTGHEPLTLTTSERTALGEVGTQLYTVSPTNGITWPSHDDAAPDVTAILVTDLSRYGDAIKRFSSTSGAAIRSPGGGVAHLLVLYNHYQTEDRPIHFNYKTTCTVIQYPLFSLPNLPRRRRSTARQRRSI